MMRLQKHRRERHIVGRSVIGHLGKFRLFLSDLWSFKLQTVGFSLKNLSFIFFIVRKTESKSQTRQNDLHVTRIVPIFFSSLCSFLFPVPRFNNSRSKSKHNTFTFQETYVNMEKYDTSKYGFIDDFLEQKQIRSVLTEPFTQDTFFQEVAQFYLQATTCCQLTRSQVLRRGIFFNNVARSLRKYK